MALIRPVFLLLLLLLSLAFASVSTTLDAAAVSADTDWGLTNTDSEEDFEEETAPQTCGSGTAAGECSSAVIGDDDDDEGDNATVKDTDAEEGANVSRRGLAGAYPAGRTRFISYAALTKNRIPCSRRGHSYYNCSRRKRANPYRRGCSIITRCARILH